MLNGRLVTGEIMDQPGIGENAHRQALEDLRKINLASRTAEQMLEPIARLARGAALKRLSMLDIACGGADVPVEVAAGLKRLGLTVDLTLLDRSGTALEHARAAANRAGINCRCVQADALSQLPVCQADVVTSSLFLHHVPDADQVVVLLGQMRRIAQRMAVISDLRRSALGWFGAWAGCRMLSRSAIVHHDGPASVRASWTRRELRKLASDAGMSDASIYRSWPWRMLLVWQK